MCTSFENLDGRGHGAKLEPTCMVVCPPPGLLQLVCPIHILIPSQPFTLLSHRPWRGGLDYKLSALRLRHMAGFISLARDRDTGRVFPDPASGKPRIDYSVSAFDAAHALEGLVGLAKICYVTGAREIDAFVPELEPFVRTDDNDNNSNSNNNAKVDLGVTDPAFAAWLAKLRAVGNAPPYSPFASAHQMGTCRMSSHAGAGVVDSRGQVWGTEELYVADASVFPSASGVNPMVTVMAIADWIARGVANDLRGKGGGP